MAGEVHYFRVARDEWEQRIRLLKEAGCNAVASYIPWLWHELPDGSIDVTGRTRPERDVAAFIDLVPRPRPVVHRPARAVHHGRAEERGPAVPRSTPSTPRSSRRLGRHARADAAPSTTSRRPSSTSASAGTPRSCRCSPPRLQPRGGNVIGVQLDNEIGMLAWVTNSPDLTDDLLVGLRATWCAGAARRRRRG